MRLDDLNVELADLQDTILCVQSDLSACCAAGGDADVAAMLEFELEELYNQQAMLQLEIDDEVALTDA